MIERYKSGFQPPEDFPFEDLSRQNTFENGSTMHMNTLPTLQKLEPGFTVKGTISAGKIKKRVGIFNIFGSNKVNFIYITYDTHRGFLQLCYFVAIFEIIQQF